MLISDYRTKSFTGDKRRHLIIKIVQIHQESMITNFITTNKRAPKHMKQKL